MLALAFGGDVMAQQGWEPTVVSPAEESPVQRFAPRYIEPATPDTPAPRQGVTDAPKQGAFRRKAAQVPQTALAASERDRKPAIDVQPVAAPVARARHPVETGALEGGPARQYCANIADAAADARFALQKRALADMEQQIERRIALLEAKTAEYQLWVTRRDEFVKKAQEGLISIYARMRAESAAQQLAAMDEETASAIVMKLDSRIASTILNEMQPTQAARLAAVISGAAKVPPPVQPKREGRDKQP
ncbi:MAG: MotE family protein [Hyphomicrobiaceae bacterium]|nr:MAG: MotE family protein [Hyphomicrobiaceae bacterium]